MKYVKKVLAGMLLAGVMVAANGEQAYAASHVRGCSADDVDVVCVGPMSGSSNTVSHLLYQSVNGPVYCQVVSIFGRHDIYCSNKENCGVYLGSSNRTHVNLHSDCPDETGICQR